MPHPFKRGACLLNKLVLVVGLVFAAPATAQFKLDIPAIDLYGEVFSLKNPLLITECDATGKTIGGPLKLAPRGAEFTVVRDIGDSTYVIRFGNWLNKKQVKKSIGEPARLLGTVKTNDQKHPSRYDEATTFNFDVSNKADIKDRFFLLTKAELEGFGMIEKGSFSPTYGAMTLPFKYRVETEEVLKDVALSGLGGVQLNTEKGNFHVALVTGVGISSVEVDSANTEGNETARSDRGSITVPVGLVLDWHHLQIGVFGGWDWLFDNKEAGWIHNGKPWLAIGIGMGIYSEQLQKKNPAN